MIYSIFLVGTCYIVFVVIDNNFTYVPRWNMRIYVVWHFEHGFTVTVIYIFFLCVRMSALYVYSSAFFCSSLYVGLVKVTGSNFGICILEILTSSQVTC